MTDRPPHGDFPLQELGEEIASHLSHSWRFGSLERLCPPKTAVDDPAKLLVRDVRGRPVAVVKCSSSTSPTLIARESSLARQARAALGPRLGTVVLESLLEGNVGGRSFVVLPYCRQIGERWPLKRLAWRWWRRRVLDWLYNVTLATLQAVDSVAAGVMYREPLRWIAGNDAVTSGFRDAAAAALQRLECGEWRTNSVLMHGDFWGGNVLCHSMLGGLGVDWGGMVVIDWAGARLQGYPFVDLVTMARSLRLPHRRFRAEWVRHCAALCTDTDGAIGYLAAGLGCLGQHLEQFPMERFLALVEATWRAVSELREHHDN